MAEMLNCKQNSEITYISTDDEIEYRTFFFSAHYTAI